MESVFLKRLGRRAAFLRAWFHHGGWSRAIDLVGIMAVEPCAVRLAAHGWKTYGRLRHLWRTFRADKQVRAWQTRRAQVLAVNRPWRQTRIEDLGLDRERLAGLRRALAGGEEVVLGDFDRDSFLLSRVGPLQGLDCVDGAHYVERPAWRYGVQLVAKADWVGVKKSFRGKKVRFLNELSALDKLGRAGCRVPPIVDIDFDALSITTAYVRGTNLRELLARAEAIVRDRDVAVHPSFQGLSAAEVFDRRIANALAVLDRVVDTAFVDEVFQQLRRMHSAGVVWGDFHYGNILIEHGSGLPVLVDFDPSVDASRMDRHLRRVLADHDIEKFNKHFGRRQWTWPRVHQVLESPAGSPFDGGVYAPFSIGHGLYRGPLWSLASGYGRWQYILGEHLPPVAGRRVLDLGANNGFNALQLLRQGARQVVALELDARPIRQGEMLREFYEWADNRTYDLRYVSGNMVDLERLNLGRFDMVLSLCSLYHLDGEADMRRVIRAAARLSDVFVVQANHAPRQPVEKQARARVEYLESLLRQGGFDRTTTITAGSYGQPLVIGVRTDQEAATSRHARSAATLIAAAWPR